MSNRNNNQVIPFNGYILVSNVEQVKGFKLFNNDGGKIDVFRGKVEELPPIGGMMDTSSVLKSVTWIYFKGNDSGVSDFDKMVPMIECTDEKLIGIKFIMIPKDRILFPILESNTIMLPKIVSNNPTRKQ